MFYDFLEWISYWTGAWAISAVEWLQRTTQYAGDFFFKSWELYRNMYGTLLWLVTTGVRVALEWSIAWADKARELFEFRYMFVTDLMVDLFEKLVKVCRDWWTRETRVFTTWWEWVNEWFNGWVQFLVPLLEDHKVKILYGLTDGWPKVWWFINDRWTTLFGSIEGHIGGWETFVDDPAQAIWDWVEPRLQELGAKFLVKVW